MFGHILIPLDGSAAGEAAVGVGVFLAGRSGGRVTLLHLIEAEAPAAVHGERHLRTAAEAEEYLRNLVARLVPAAIPVTCHVHAPLVHDVADGIAQHMLELAPDLIVMSVHGSHGLRRLLFGDMAQQVAARSQVPVILVREPPQDHAFTGWKCVLIPHNTDSAHEDALPAGFEVARLCRARTHVVMAVETPGSVIGDGGAATLLPSATRAVLELTGLDAERHLKKHCDEMQAAGMTVTTEICRGAIVPSIRKAAARVGADLIVLGTHGHAGTEAFWEGSIAARICAGSDVSVMLVPAAHGPAE